VVIRVSLNSINILQSWDLLVVGNCHTSDYRFLSSVMAYCLFGFDLVILVASAILVRLCLHCLYGPHILTMVDTFFCGFQLQNSH
jgi:hypothetical protein